MNLRNLMAGNDGWPDKANTPKMVDEDTRLRLMLFFIQNWGDVSEWTKLEWSRSWPIRAEEPKPHLVFGSPKFVFPNEHDNATKDGQKDCCKADAKLNGNGESLTSSKSLQGKCKVGAAVLPLTNDNCRLSSLSFLRCRSFFIRFGIF